MADSNSSRAKGTTPVNNEYGHIPPQALEMEASVLGSLMIDGDAFSVVGELLQPESFYDKRHQKIYSAIRTLAMKETHIDAMTVVEQLKLDGNLDAAGGPLYIMELTDLIVSTAGVEEHARTIKKKYTARQLIAYATYLETKAFNEDTEVDELMQEAEGRLFELSQKNMVQEYTHIGPVVNRSLEDIHKAASKSTGLSGLESGYDKLDSITSGWQPSDLIIVAGRPAMGKTAFALSMAKNMVVDYKIPVAFFSLEMNNEQLANRLISNICEISGTKIMNGQLSPDEWQRLDANVGYLQDSPLYVDDTAGLSVFELRTKARRLVREHGVKMIMIDYLQLMNANGMRFNSRQEEVSTISRSLKGLAKELNIPILALSQLNRGLEGREGIEGKRPQLSDLRESGAIEQDADMVIFVHRPEYFRIFEDEKGNDLRGKAQIIIAKHRKGAVGDVLLNFKGDYTRFENPDGSQSSPGNGGEIMGSRLNTGEEAMPGIDYPPADMPFAPPPPDMPF